MLARLLKTLHQLGAIGTLGSIASCIVLLQFAPTKSAPAFAGVLQGIAALSKWLLVPSLALVLTSGLLAIAANSAYKNAGWAWVKALLGISSFEGTLMTVGASARRAGELSAAVAAGQPDAAQLSEVLRTEWGGLWILAALALVNIVLAVWRPRLGRRADR